MDYCLLIPSQSRVLCRGEQLLLTFFDRGSRQLKLIRAGFKGQGAESAGRLFLISCSSTCRSTCIMRDLKSPAPIPDPGLILNDFPLQIFLRGYFAFHVKRSEEHTSELQSQFHLVCRLLLEKKNNTLI